jgi:DnaJ-class molecular chaperone
MAHLAPTEITALAGILGELDYYQLLNLNTDAKPSDIKRAYHATSRTFHPDTNRHQEPNVRLAIDEIAKRIAEAYSILRNPRRRKAYDQQIEAGSGVRM